MKQVIVNIKDNKYSFFLELMNSMDFVSIKESSDDWYENSSPNDKKLIQEGINDLDNGNVFSHEEVISLGKKRILELKNK